MKIYTKTGDDGETGLFGGPRVPKDHIRIGVYGAIDELNAVLGVVRTCSLSDTLARLIDAIQHTLFAIGAELATPDPDSHGMKWEGQAEIASLEQAIDQLDAELPALRNFILPGGSSAAAHLQVARTICRRCEREAVHLARTVEVSDMSSILVYLNRLSDLLFVMARWCNQEAGRQDVVWKGRNAR